MADDKVASRQSIEELLRVHGWAKRQLLMAFGVDESKFHLAVDDCRQMAWARAADGCVQYAETKAEMCHEGDYFVEMVKAEYRLRFEGREEFVLMHIKVGDGTDVEELMIFDGRNRMEPF